MIEVRLPRVSSTKARDIAGGERGRRRSTGSCLQARLLGRRKRSGGLSRKTVERCHDGAMKPIPFSWFTSSGHDGIMAGCFLFSMAAFVHPRSLFRTISTLLVSALLVLRGRAAALISLSTWQKATPKGAAFCRVIPLPPRYPLLFQKERGHLTMSSLFTFFDFFENIRPALHSAAGQWHPGTPRCSPR